MAARMAADRLSPGCAATQRAAGSCGSTKSPLVRLSGLAFSRIRTSAAALGRGWTKVPLGGPAAGCTAASAESNGMAATDAMTTAAVASAAVRLVTLCLTAIRR
jgi:hypothetical protein